MWHISRNAKQTSKGGKRHRICGYSSGNAYLSPQGLSLRNEKWEKHAIYRMNRPIVSTNIGKSNRYSVDGDALEHSKRRHAFNDETASVFSKLFLDGKATEH